MDSLSQAAAAHDRIVAVGGDIVSVGQPDSTVGWIRRGCGIGYDPSIDGATAALLEESRNTSPA
jgi:hypothetical protein